MGVTKGPLEILESVKKKYEPVIWLAGMLLLLLPGTNSAQAQFDGRKTEVGVQFSLFRQSERLLQVGGPIPLSQGAVEIIPVVRPYLSLYPVPIPTVSLGVGQDIGFGGRVGYNFSNYIAAEGEVNFFPTARQSSGGRKTQAVFGVKAGGRVDNFGLFAKVRPGLMNFSDIPEGGSDTNFALDVGAVVEYYPSRRTLIRVDLSDVIVQFDERTYSPPIGILGSSGGFVFGNITDFLQQPATPSTPIAPQPVAAPIRISWRRLAVTTHNFQLSVGFGLRF